MPVKRILIVDDSLTERQYLSELLSEFGYACSLAVNGEDGIAKARSEHPDLILMDVVMPGTNGFQAWKPLVPGITTSIRIRSGCSLRALAIPSSPLTAREHA